MSPLFKRNKETGGTIDQPGQQPGFTVPELPTPTTPEQGMPGPQVGVTEAQPTLPVNQEKGVQQETAKLNQEPHTVTEASSPDRPQAGVRSKAKATQQQQVAATPLPKTPERQEIEKVLSERLVSLYQTMTPQEQEAFRIKGDETATAIEELMKTFKASARKVLALIRDWLATIPRVNKFFLEQESKLKTDEMIKLQRKLKHEKRLNSIGRE